MVKSLLLLLGGIFARHKDILGSVFAGLAIFWAKRYFAASPTA
jgi:hypothetical protein